MSYVAFLAPGLVCVAAMNGASFEVTYNIFVRLNFEKAYDAMLTTPIEPRRRPGRRGAVGDDAGRASTAAASSSSSPCSAWRRCRRALLALPVIPLAGLLFAAIGIAFSLRVHDHRPVQLLLHAVPDAAVSVLRRLLPAEGAAGRPLAVGGRSAAAAPPRAPRAQRLRRPGWTWSSLWDVAYILGVSAVLLAWLCGAVSAAGERRHARVQRDRRG